MMVHGCVPPLMMTMTRKTRGVYRAALAEVARLLQILSTTLMTDGEAALQGAGAKGKQM